MKIYRYTLILVLLVTTGIMHKANAQIIRGQYVITTFNVNFDSLKIPLYAGDTIIVDTSHTDTTNTALWQIGKTHKSYFADTGSAKGIMTDTLNPYPINANSWFVLKGVISQFYINPIISFWHKYDMDSLHAGGMVEVSFDTGHSWINVMDSCIFYYSSFMAVLDSNFYRPDVKVINNQAAFTGNSNGWKRSTFQIFYAMPVKMSHTSGASCMPNVPVVNGQNNIVQVRFRFASDSTQNNKDGWLIGNIGIEEDYFGNSVNKLTTQSEALIYPNPSDNGLFFVNNNSSENVLIEVTNLLGQIIYTGPANNTINLSHNAKGLYSYRLYGSGTTQTGKLWYR